MSWAIWITGLPGSGKSTVARGVAAALAARGTEPVTLELDALRRVLTPVARYTAEERTLVYGVLVHVARLLVDEGIPVILDATAHRRAWRDLARAVLPAFAEVHLFCPLDVCRERERTRPEGHAPRGIYDAGGRPGSTVPGVDVPYEAPTSPELAVDTAATPLTTTVERVVDVALALERATPSRAQPGGTGWAIWITGLPGSGKTTLARHLADALATRPVRVLDIDTLRQAVLGGARPTPTEDDVLHRALVVAAGALTAVGVRVVVDAVATRRVWRDLARERIPQFAEVHVVAPLAVCCERERAVRWRLTAPPGGGRWKTQTTEGPDVVLDYEYSLAPDLTLHTDVLDIRSAARELLRIADRLERRTRSATQREETTMRVRELMTRGLITASRQTTVMEARTLMANERIRHLLVTDAGRLVGIVTDRDIRLNLASPATTLSVWELNYLLAKLTVGEVMTKSLIVVDPDRDAREAARIMLDHKVGALPVLEGDRLVGILTETDLVRAFAETPESAVAAR